MLLPLCGEHQGATDWGEHSEPVGTTSHMRLQRTTAIASHESSALLKGGVDKQWLQRSDSSRHEGWSWLDKEPGGGGNSVSVPAAAVPLLLARASENANASFEHEAESLKRAARARGIPAIDSLREGHLVATSGAQSFAVVSRKLR